MAEGFRIGVLVSGRGSNLQSIIDACETGQVAGRVALVVSDVENAYALERARAKGIEAVYHAPGRYKTRLDPEREQGLVDLLRDREIDLVCMAGFMRIIHAPLLEAFKGRIMNIHPSLLPSFPGLDVQQAAIDHGAKFSGCTVHFAAADFDEGPIICQAAVPIEDDDTADVLAARILEQEHRIYPEAIQLFVEGRLQLDGRRVRRLPNRGGTR